MRAFLLAAAILFLPATVFARTPDDQLYDEQWYLSRIHAPDAWSVSTGSSNTVIAVLDVGIDQDHEDLQPNLWRNLNEVEGNGRDDDGNGFIDDVHGWDFVDDDATAIPDTGPDANADAVAHGSLVAGLIGAVGDNGTGVTGVLWDASIMPVRILDASGSGSSREVAKGIRYAVDNGADVINLSFVGDANDIQLRAAIRAAFEAGVVIVAAMGNNGEDTDVHTVYPACYHGSEDDWVIGVGATDRQDRFSDFSNYGSECTDIAAPGEDIFGLIYEDPSEGFDDAYEGDWSGTSMASPLVAGAAALLKTVYDDLTPQDIVDILKLSADPVDATSTELEGKIGAGRLNIEAALEIAEDFVTSPPEDVPSSEESPDSNVSPATGAQEDVTEVLIGDYVKSPSFDTVYRVTNSYGRLVFMDANTYFTWSDTFADITSVTDATLPTMSLEGLMLPKPGVVLVKIVSVPTVYAIEENPYDEFSPILRALENEEIASAMYGAAWADYVIDIPDTSFTKFRVGDPITAPESVDLGIMKTRQQLSQLAQ